MVLSVVLKCCFYCGWWVVVVDVVFLWGWCGLVFISFLVGLWLVIWLLIFDWVLLELVEFGRFFILLFLWRIGGWGEVVFCLVLIVVFGGIGGVLMLFVVLMCWLVFVIEFSCLLFLGRGGVVCFLLVVDFVLVWGLFLEIWFGDCMLRFFR